MAPAIFKNMVFATAGSLPGQFTEENLAMWSKQRKGQFVKDMDESVTHLLCTDEQYKARSKNKRIKEAQKKGRRIRIVHYDWFDFSCNNNKKLPEKEYYFDTIRAEERAKQRKQIAKAQAQKNLAIGENWINPDLYRIFADAFPFEYQVELLRTFTDEFGTCHEKYVLHLFQSHAKPTLYWFGVKYYKKDDNKRWLLKALDRPSYCSRPFNVEFRKFKDFFKLKTGIHWHERISKAGTTEKTYFQYTPPAGGKPVGKGLTTGMTYEDCLEQNRQLRQKYYELFGDALPEEKQDATASEGSEDKDCKQLAQSNNADNIETAVDKITMDQSEAEDAILDDFDEQTFNKLHDLALYPVIENQHKHRLFVDSRADRLNGRNEVALAKASAAFLSAPHQEQFNKYADVRHVSKTPKRIKTINSPSSSRAPRDKQQHKATGKIKVVSIGGNKTQRERKSVDDLNDYMALNAAIVESGIRAASKAKESAYAADKGDYSNATMPDLRRFPDSSESREHIKTVCPQDLISPDGKLEIHPVWGNLKPSDIAKLRANHDRTHNPLKRKAPEMIVDTDVFRSPDGPGKFMGAAEPRVSAQRIKKAGLHHPKVRQITKTMQRTAAREINRESTSRPLSEEQVAHIFSQPIPGPVRNTALDDDFSMDLTFKDVSEMVDEMFGESKYDDGSKFMTEVYGERPWPDDHDPARPENGLARTDTPAEDIDTRNLVDESPRPVAPGSSGTEMGCDTDIQADDLGSDISMALSTPVADVSVKIGNTRKEGHENTMKGYTAALGESDLLTEDHNGFPHKDACIAPFADEGVMFHSARIYLTEKGGLNHRTT